MSKIKWILEVEPPIIGREIERISLPIIECPACHGRGGRLASKFDEEYSTDINRFIACIRCKGSGKLSAKVSIDWSAKDKEL